MTPEEIEALVEVGESTYLAVTQLICTWVMYGLYFASFLMAARVYLRKSIGGYYGRILLILMILVFLCISWYCIELADFLSNLNVASTKLSAWERPVFWGPTINLIIGDGVVLWRAWVIWDLRHPKWQKIFLGSCLMLLWIINLCVNVLDAAFDDVDIEIQASAGAITLDWVSLVVSFVVNAVATSMIGFKAWRRHRDARYLSLRGVTRSQSPTQRVLLILVESGALFCVVQLFYAIVNGIVINNVSPVTGLELVYAVITAIGNGSAALYPLAVILIIHLEVSPLTNHKSSGTSLTVNDPDLHDAGATTGTGIELQTIVPRESQKSYTDDIFIVGKQIG